MNKALSIPNKLYQFSKIALVTPLKNECENIDRLIDSIETQSIPIYHWLILENDSNDGSEEKLQAYKERGVKNVEHFRVINLDLEDKQYKLGIKYSSIINQGFSILQEEGVLNNSDFIGILDSDCFPEKNYYEELLKYFELNKKLGISSGLIYNSKGKRDIASSNWVRGGCRLWKKECFEQSGYVVAPSADTISACKAMLMGWEVKPNKSLKVISRMKGDKVNYEYYGYSCYFRGYTVIYALLRYLKVLFIQGLISANQYFTGYFKAWINKRPRIDDLAVKNYFRTRLRRRLLEFLKIK